MKSRVIAACALPVLAVFRSRGFSANGLAKRIALLVFGLGAVVPREATASGSWQQLANTAPDSVWLMLLLPDGSVMAANNPNSVLDGIGSDWYRLTPDPNGHYVNGEWTHLATMHDSRLFYSSQVLTNGRVFVAGGEYGSGTSRAELYDPLANTWTQINPPISLMNPALPSPILLNGNEAFVDSVSEILPNGNVLVAPVGANAAGETMIYNTAASTWSNGPTLYRGNYQDEASWVKLRDDSILTIDPFGTNCERYIPSINQWVNDSNVPVVMYSPVGGELGAAFLLPNGKAFFLGASGHTVIYTATGNTNAGSWVQGPDIPGGLVAADAPAAMMPNGKILVSAAGPPYLDGSGNPQFPTPTSFFEYDYSVGPTGTFTQVSGPTGTTDNIASYQSMMLDLPDGTVLYCHVEQGNLFYSGFGSQLYVYVPDGTPVTSGKPVITSITPNGDGSYQLTGTGLNGISEGAAFGDDAQMSCNYPIIAFQDTNNGHVDYARSYNWNSTSVQSGSKVVTTQFVLPPGLIPQTYLVTVIAAGLSSAPVVFSFVTPSTLSMCPGDSGSLSVITSPQPATYQWLYNSNTLTGQTNQTLNFVNATNTQAGFYSLKVTSGGGSYISQPVQVSVGVWVIQPPPPTNTATLCQPYTLSVLAQGKGPLTAHWFRNGIPVALDSRISTNSAPQGGGGTTLSLNFMDTKYQDDGTYTVTITDSCTQVTTAPFALRIVPNPPWVQVATQGPPRREYAAMAYDSDRHVSVLFGGLTNNSSGTFAGDTWEFDGSNWTQRFPSNSPAARDEAQMVYDSQRHRTVLFGGQIVSNGLIKISLETWEWDGTNWQSINTPHVPGWTVPDIFAACYDSVRGETLIYGGEVSAGRVYQLWGYKGTDWTQKTPAGATPVAPSPLMTFDSLRSVAVLLGGDEQSVPTPFPYPQDSVWEWDGTIWHERPQSGQLFGGSSTTDVLAFDTFRGESVLYGYVFGEIDGVSSSSYPSNYGYRFVWRWNGAQWQADPPTPTTGGATLELYSSMCFDTLRNALVLFGGEDINASLDTNATYEILYQDDPAVLKQPLIQANLQGQQVQLSVLAAGAPPIQYQWQKGTSNLTDGGRVSGSTSNTLTINAAVPADSGDYRVSLMNICGAAVSQSIILNISTGPSTLAIGVPGGSGGVGAVITWGDSTPTLQTATNLAGPWSIIPGATSPYPVNPNMPAQFFRLIYP